MTIARVALAGIFLSILFSAALAAEPLPRSVSTSRQFVVYGSDAVLRGSICDLAERAKKDLLGVLQTRDDWKTPIVINAQSPQANIPEMPRAALNFSQTGFGLKLQLDLVVPADVKSAAIEREILRAVLIEMAYRQEQDLPAGTAYAAPPDWLLDGVLANNSDPSILIEALGALVATNNIMPLHEFLQQRPELLDSPSRELYRAYAFALIEMLTEPAEGRGALTKFILDLPRSSTDPVADLEAHFPMLRGTNGEKVWMLSVARISAAERYRALSAAETEKRLDDLLLLKITAASGSTKTFALEDFPQWMPLADRGAALTQMNQGLLILSARANPIYRSVVSEYEQIGTLLAAGKISGIAPRLLKLKSARAEISGRMQSIDDYMNWFEATQAETRSGMFVEYLKAAARTLAAEYRRRDPISIYLDVLETQFQK